MARGPKKHLKRLNAPSSWMLDKLSGTYAPRPSPGPHKLRECLPLTVFLRNRLKYALTGKEVLSIVKQRLIKIDNKVRTDPTYPAGFMGTLLLSSSVKYVITIEKSGEHFRLLYDVKGRFTIHRITLEESTYKLLKVRKVAIGARGVPHVVTHDGRTIRYPDPSIQVNDTVKFDLEQAKIMCIITGGRNMGRAGVIVHREKHIGGFDIVHVKDSLDRTFATRVTNIFVIGEGNKPWISLPKGKGTKLTISEERDLKRKRAAEQ
ncbi:ribosomal family S4e-domain-containing protein [Mycena sp. CBHHK59/15]|nr:ribosomal family S4e-domain-containing protein [Mycena sp. CBHHK59/15]